MAGSRKKGQLAILQFYQVINAKGVAERRVFEDSISKMSEKGKQLMMKKRRSVKNPRLQAETEAVTEVIHKIIVAIRGRIKGYQMIFEPQLLFAYFAELIFMLGSEEGSSAVRSAAVNTSWDLFVILETAITAQKGGISWDEVGQLGFIRKKLQQHHRKAAINSLFVALDLRLRKAMQTVDPKIFELPENTLKNIQDSADRDAKAILRALVKEKRADQTRTVIDILQHLIKPLVKKILSNYTQSSRAMSMMTSAQWIDIRTYFFKTKTNLIIITGGPAAFKPHVAGMKLPVPHKMTTTTLHLSYDPKTQLGMVLCLRARLGQHFKLRFHPIGVNGTKRKRGGKQRDLNPRDPKKQKAFTILSFPVELIYYITGFMVKSHPTPEETRGLFAFARSTSELRFYIEDPGLENVISRKFLGTQHTRNREERRMGLEPNVAKRYKAVFKLLGLKDKNIKALQAKANRNIQTYKIEVEKRKKAEESREKEWTIRSWPWWYFRALANHRSFQSLANPFVDDESDIFSMALISVVALQPDPMSTYRPARTHRLRTFSEGANVDSAQFLLDIVRGNTKPADRYDWQKWTSGADLMVIPIDRLVQRALTYSYNIGRKMELKGPTNLTISVSEPMPVSRPSRGLASFRKEVVMTGLSDLPDTLGRHVQSRGKAKIIDFDLRLVLQIQQAYLGNAWSQFLGPKRKPLPYLHLESLSLEHVYFEKPKAPPKDSSALINPKKDLSASTNPLDLSALTGEFLSELRFGPSNSRHVPKLFCPTPHLTHLRLVAPNTRNSILLWNLEGINPASCFPNLDHIHIGGNVNIWTSPAVLKLSKFPKLRSITLEKFPGTLRDLRRLGKALEQAPQSDIPGGHYPHGITVWVRFIPPNTDYSVQGGYDFNFKGVYFRDFYGSHRGP